MKLFQRAADREYLAMAYREAQKSPDPSTQNGAIIVYSGTVISKSCNRFPRGVLDLPDRWNDRDVKLKYVNHAERRAVTLAARNGTPLVDSTMYCPWYACEICAQAIIDSGIKRVVGHQKYFDSTPDRWRGLTDIGLSMLREAGVICDLIQEDLGLDFQVRFNGTLWTP